MKLQNLIFNRLGNNLSVMISNPEIQIMEKIESPIIFEEKNLFYEVEGISTVHFDGSILQIFLKLYSENFEYDAYIKFLQNGNIFVEAKEDFSGTFQNGIFILEMVEEYPVWIFKLSAVKLQYSIFEKKDKYKLKIKEEHLIKGILELTYHLNK